MIDTTKSLSGVSYNGSTIPFEIPEKGEYHVQAIDYDGTVIKEDWLNTGDVFELPAYPVHTGLTAQEWSCPQAITNNTITVEDMDVTMGVVYTTTSGLCEFDIKLTSESGLEVTLNMSGGTFVNWGDGTTDANTTHTYASAGSYTISTDHTTDGSSSSGGIFGQTSSSINKFLQEARLSSTFTSSMQYTFGYCPYLTIVIIPKSNNIYTVDYYCFYQCYSLKRLICSSKLYIFGQNCCFQCYDLEYLILSYNNVQQIAFNPSSFSNTYNLKELYMPKQMYIGSGAFSVSGIKKAKFGFVKRSTSGSIGSMYQLKHLILLRGSVLSDASIFSGNSYLQKIVLPNNLTTIGTSVFNDSTNLNEVLFPSTVTSIGANSFANCRRCRKYDFSNASAIPTLVNTNAFTSINAVAKIIVPDSLYENWITASNWVTYANYIYKASEVE